MEKLYAAEKEYYDAIKKGDLFFENKEYIEAKSIDLGLITKDLDQIHEMTNSYSVLMRYLRIRTDVELPKLTNRAEKIIILLKETYLD